MKKARRFSIMMLGPGILVAATGVGAGDLATATLTGAHLGTAVLWAVLVGAGLKFLLNEGLARWQLATGTTLLEGLTTHLGRPMQGIFLAYLLVWSYLVAMALMSACGVAAQAMFPLFDDPSRGKIVFGIAQSLLATILVIVGGYSLFEKVMGVCIGVMFVVVTTTAFILRPRLADIATGLVWPVIPEFHNGGLGWTIALLGGVGGTVTVLCYGYWIREAGRNTPEDLPTCRIDLAVGYIMTAIFGIAMVIIGSQLGKLDAKGATLIIQVAETLETRLDGYGGLVAKWAFLFGAWGAVFSSLLGVWQSVPYLFADFWRLLRPASPTLATVDNKSPIYRVHLLAIAIIPISGLFLFDFSSAMKINGMVGAIFIPMLAVVLLILNGRASLVGVSNRNSYLTTVLLALTLVVFVIAGGFQIVSSIG